MPWPLSQDYNEAIQNPGQCFADPELRQGEAVTNALGLPVPCSGNFADVYAVKGGANKWAVKCFTREIPGLQERYVQISAYLKRVQLPFMVDFAFLPQGIRVRGQWFPALKMQWVEGFPLNTFVRDNLDKPQLLQTLCLIWSRLAAKLREAKLAHCDLQHGNVLLVPGSKAGTLGVKLVDYDGMCVPALELLKSIELGHANFQHPQRLKEGTYGLQIDRFPHLVIYTALRALTAGGKALWDKFDNGDNLLFTQADLAAPQQAAVFQALRQLKDPLVVKLADTLAMAAQGPIDRVPLLTDLLPKEPVVPTEKNPAASSVPKPAAGDSFAGLSGETGGRTTKNRAQAAPNRLPLIIGAVAAGVLVAALGLFVAMRGSNEPTRPAELAERTQSVPGMPTTPRTHPAVAVVPTERARPETTPETRVEPKEGPKTESKSEPTPKEEPKTEPKPVPKQEPKDKPFETVNLLKLIDPERDAILGKWTVQDRVLISPAERGARLQLPFIPPDEYTMTLRVERKQRDQFLAVGLVVGGRQCMAVIDKGPHSGLEYIDGKVCDKNETSRGGRFLKDGQSNEIVFSVRKTGVTTTVNGETLLSYKGDPQRLTLHKDWMVREPKALFVGSNATVYHFTKLELTPISAPGTYLRQSSESPSLDLRALAPDPVTQEAVRRSLQKLEESNNSALRAEEAQKNANIALGLVDAALRADDFDAAGRLSKVAQALAEKTKSKSLQSQIETRTREREADVQAMREQHSAFTKAADKLKGDPNDTAAITTIGAYLCCWRGEWDKGLPILARGGNQELADLARRDLNNPVEAAQQVALANDWWQAAQKRTALDKQRLEARARVWYWKALPNLPAKDKAKAAERLTFVAGKLELKPGLIAELCQGHQLEDLKKRRIDYALDFEWGHGSPDPAVKPNNYSNRWMGWLRPPTLGRYTLIADSDDGCRLWLDGKLVYSDWRLHAARRTFEVELNGPVHHLTVDHVQGGAHACFHLGWIPPGGKEEIVPREAFYHDQEQEDMLGDEPFAKFKGKWAINYSNGATRVYEIEANGDVAVIGGKKKVSHGRLLVQGSDRMITFPDARWERVRFDNGKLSVEVYAPWDHSFTKPDYVGTGTKK